MSKAVSFSLSQKVDLYCERSDFGFWAEPINAVSNFGFLIVGVWGLSLFLRSTDLNRASRMPGVILSSLCCLIGVGSFWFHTEASYLSQLGDLIPIFAFCMLYLWHAVKNELHWSNAKATIGAVTLAGSMSTTPFVLPKDFINGSGLYLPVWGALFGLTLAAFLKKNPTSAPAKSKVLWTGAISVFTLSLFFRSVDISWCDGFRHGTHFIWHVLNAVLLGLLLKLQWVQINARPTVSV